jgi:mediator of RNA polymerase II transcription subunit 18, fungi type
MELKIRDEMIMMRGKGEVEVNASSTVPERVESKSGAQTPKHFLARFAACGFVDFDELLHDTLQPPSPNDSSLTMQDLLLYSQVPATRYGQLLQILAGVTASQPASIFEQHLVFEQLTLPAPAKKAQPNINQRRTYQYLVRDRHVPSTWRHRSIDMPDPAAKQVISRAVTETTVTGPSLAAFQPGSTAYRLVSHHCLVGSRFVSGNVVVSVNRICRGAHLSEDPTEGFLPDLANLHPLDSSGSYVVEAYVRIADGSTTSLRDRASKELLSFAESLKGSVDLRVPDRFAMDPRLKS